MKKIVCFIFALLVLFSGLAFADKYDVIEGVWININLFTPNADSYAFVFYEDAYEHGVELKAVSTDDQGNLYPNGNVLSGTFFFYENQIVMEMEELYDVNGNLLEVGYEKYLFVYSIFTEEEVMYLGLDDGYGDENSVQFYAKVQ